MAKKKENLKPKNLAKTIKRLLAYYQKEKALFIFAILLVILGTIFQVAANGMLSPIIDAVAVDKDMGKLIRYLQIMVAFVILITVSQYFGGLWMAKLAQRIVHRLREELFHKLQKMPVGYYDSEGHGRIMSSYTNDVEMLTQALEQSTVQIITSVFGVVGTLIMMLVLSPFLTLVYIILLVISLLMVSAVAKKSSHNFRARQSDLADMNAYVEEMISAQKVVKVFGYENRNRREFAVVNESLRATSSKAAAYGVMMMPLMGNFTFVQYAVLAMLGAVRVMSGTMSIGNIAAFLQYTRTISRPITMVSNQLNSILMAVAGAERIFEILDAEEEEVAGPVRLVSGCQGDRNLCWSVPKEGGGQDLVPVAGDIRLENLDFSYVPGKPVLEDVSLYAKPGQKIALVGSTGAGKTTITNLINRFYEIDDGLITIDGIDIRKIHKLDLRSIMSMVLQDVHLFEGTIADNIRFGRLDATDEEVRQAAELANADGFISQLNDGFNTYLGNDAMSLSQGERQLLSIARAAIADPVILILDEATSSVDTRTEALIEKGMDELMKGRTTFVIAHRLSTVRRADAIIVLENGRIVERGDHDELMAMKGRYYRLTMGTEELT